MYNEQCTLGAGLAVIPVQAVGLQGSVAKEPHGPNRTPEVCGEPDPSYPACLRGIILGETTGLYVWKGMCIAGRKYELSRVIACRRGCLYN